jgi:hypothetical protein
MKHKDNLQEIINDLKDYIYLNQKYNLYIEVIKTFNQYQNNYRNQYQNIQEYYKSLDYALCKLNKFFEYKIKK